MKRCLEIRERLMPRHHFTGFAHHQMGALLYIAGNYQESIVQFIRALDILMICECHPGAICRTALALSAALATQGSVEAERYHEVVNSYRARIHDTDVQELGEDAAQYDRFVAVGLG